jgi:hypothetical protein
MDSNQRISAKAMLVLAEEQVKQQKKTGKRPVLKDLIETAIIKAYK